MAAGNEHEEVYHVTPFSTYVRIYLILLGLTVLTVVFALPALHVNYLSTVIALIIASTKAFLVAWYFMHQNHEGKLNRTILVSGFFFLALLFGFTIADWATRGVNFTEKQTYEAKPLSEAIPAPSTAN